MQTETLPDAPTLPGLTLIEGVDMDAEVACGHAYHATEHPDPSAPAAYIARSTHPACGRDVTYPLCRPGWIGMSGEPLICGTCGATVPPGSVRIVETLR